MKTNIKIGDEVLEIGMRGHGIIWDVVKILPNGSIKVKRYIKKDEIKKIQRYNKIGLPSSIIYCGSSIKTKDNESSLIKLKRTFKKGGYVLAQDLSDQYLELAIKGFTQMIAGRR